jgi:membrane-associated phospholipid phosphatase
MRGSGGTTYTSVGMKQKLPIFIFCCFFLAGSTCCKAQLTTDSLSGKQKTFRFFRSYTVPALSIAYGVIAIGPSTTFYDRFDAKRDVQARFPGFHTTVDNYLQFVPQATVFTLSLSGVKGKHAFWDQFFLYGGSMLLSEGIATGLKYATHTLRPDGTTYNSFPSGHTTSAFTGAECLNQEYGGTSFLYSVFGYGTAATTGYLRMMNNRHWLSDVLVGAGIGMISTKLVYAWYPKLKRRFCSRKSERPELF